MNFLKNFDLFSIPISFSFQGKRQAGSYAGAILTIFLIGFVIFIGFVISQELWLRQAPEINISNYFLKEKIYLKNFPFSLGVLDSSNQSRNDFEDYLTLEAIIMKSDSIGKVTPTFRRIVPCSQKYSSFSSEAQLALGGVVENNSLCIDFEEDDYISGEVVTVNSQYLFLYVRTCQHRKTCKSMDEIKSFLNGYKVVSMFLGTTVINGKDYKQPIVNNPQSQVLMLSFMLYKQNWFTLGKQKVKSNDGVFTDNWTEYEGLQILNTSYDYSDLFSVTKNGNLLANVIIGVSSQIELTTRTYMQISMALAKTMGFYSFLFGFIAFLLHYYQQYVLQMDFYQTLLELGYEIQENECKQLEIIKISDFTKSMRISGKIQDQKNKYLHFMKEYSFTQVMILKFQSLFQKEKNEEKFEIDQLSFYIKVDLLIKSLLSLEGLFHYILPKEQKLGLSVSQRSYGKDSIAFSIDQMQENTIQVIKSSRAHPMKEPIQKDYQNVVLS